MNTKNTSIIEFEGVIIDRSLVYFMKAGMNIYMKHAETNEELACCNCSDTLELDMNWDFVRQVYMPAGLYQVGQ